MTKSDRILFVTLSNIGDVVMTTPVLEHLLAAWPKHTIDIVADRRSSDLLRAVPRLGHIYHRDKQAGLKAQLALVKRLRQCRYELTVDVRTRLIPYLVRTQQRLMKPSERHPDQHAVEEHFCVLNTKASTPVPPCRLYLDEAADRTAAKLLQPYATQMRWLALAPGANWPGKRWPLASYEALPQLVGDLFDGIMVLGASNDLPREPLWQTDLPLLDVRGRTDLLTAAALIKKTSAFVGNDSGLGHMAAALGTPTLTLFGPGQPQRYKPWGEHCQVCYAPGQDLAALPVAEVVSSLHQLPGKG